MHETDEGIKTAVFKLQKVAGKPIPINEIGADTVVDVKLTQGIPYYCKIGVQKKKPPLTINLKYLSGEAKLLWYGSFITEKPEEKNH
jgi:hypothetical protein